MYQQLPDEKDLSKPVSSYLSTSRASWTPFGSNFGDDVPLTQFSSSHTALDINNNDDEKSVPFTPDIHKSGKQLEVDRYIKIREHVSHQYDNLQRFLENHKSFEYKSLATRINWESYKTQMTDLYASKGFLHTNPSVRQSVLSAVIKLGKISQLDEVVFCYFTLQEVMETLEHYIDTDIPSWLTFILTILAVLQIPPNSFSIHPASDAKEMIDPDYTEFEVAHPKNLVQVKFYHHILDILAEQEKKKLNPSLSWKLLKVLPAAMISASATYLACDSLEADKVTTSLITSISTALFSFLSYKGYLSSSADNFNYILTLTTFIITNLWGSLAQGIPIFSWFSDLSYSNYIGFIIYAAFLAIGSTYYILQAGPDTMESTLTYLSSKNPMYRVFSIDILSGLEISIQYVINSLRRGVGMSGIVTAIFKSFNMSGSLFQSYLEIIAGISGVDSTAKSRNSGAKYFLKDFTVNFLGQEEFVLADNKFLDFENAKKNLTVSTYEMIKLAVPALIFGSSIGIGTGYAISLFSQKIMSIIAGGGAMGLVFTLGNYRTQRIGLINNKARAKIDRSCENSQSDVNEPRVKFANTLTLASDSFMRLVSIAGMGASITIFGGDGFNKSLFHTFLFLGMAPVISEWRFLSPKSLKGTQKLVNDARKKVGYDIYAMKKLPEGKALAPLKNSYIFITDTKATSQVTKVYYVSEAGKAQPQSASRKSATNAGYIINGLETPRNDQTPIHSPQLKKVLEKIISTEEELIFAQKTLTELDAEEMEAEKNPRSCDRVRSCSMYDAFSWGISKIAVGMFGVKPKVVEVESSSSLVVNV